MSQTRSNSVDRMVFQHLPQRRRRHSDGSRLAAPRKPASKECIAGQELDVSLGAVGDGGTDRDDWSAGRPAGRGVAAAKLDERRIRLDDDMGRVALSSRAPMTPLKMPNAPPSSTTVRSPSSHFATSRRSGPS